MPVNKFAAAFFCGCLFAIPVGASVINNGSFEASFAEPGKLNSGQTFDRLQSGPGANWNTWDMIPGWTTDSGFGIEIQSNRTLNSIDAHDGAHYVELDSNNNSSMFQMVSLGLGRHVLSFQYSPRTGNAASTGIDYSIAGLFAENVSGPGGGSSVGAWTEVTREFMVQTAGAYRLSFSAAGVSDSYGGLIDSVALVPSAVPVPPAVVLLLTTLGGLGAAARLRRMA